MKTDTLIIGLLVVFLVLPFGAWIFKSHMEAKAYNRLTNSDVTTWEAMWIELRVQDGPNRQ